MEHNCGRTINYQKHERDRGWGRTLFQLRQAFYFIIIFNIPGLFKRHYSQACYLIGLKTDKTLGIM